ncbi:hypothetical protein WN943_026416 [Citrus x changshan-huyou]
MVDLVERNTVGIPSGGGVAIGFLANNPGSFSLAVRAARQHIYLDLLSIISKSFDRDTRVIDGGSHEDLRNLKCFAIMKVSTFLQHDS